VTDDDPHGRILRLEDNIEELTEVLERCRKLILERIPLGLNRGDSHRFVNERGYWGLIRFLGASDVEALFRRLAWPSY
jgi:hypothetical protein